jgi:hypothetical protein
MSKDKISEYSTTNALNTDIGGIDIDENCLPSNLNDSIREVMVHLKNFQAGTSGDSFTNSNVVITGGSINGATIGATTASTGAFTNLSYTGTLTGSTGILNIGSGQIYKDASGNVGIGTSSPTALLDVSGSNTTAKAIIQNTSAGATSFDGSGAGLELLAGGMNTTNKYTPAIKFGSTDNDFTTTNPKFGAAITAEATSAYADDTAGGMALSFWTSPNNPGTGSGLVQRLTITNAGNVGIGTTSPAQALSVSGNIVATGSIDCGTQFLGLSTDSATAPSFSFSGDTNTGMFRPGANILGISTNGSEAMRIQAEQQILFGITTTGGTGGMRIIPNGSVGSAQIDFRRTGTGGSTLMTFRQNATLVGSITYDGVGTAFNTSSDYRLKENIVDAPTASDSIDAIQIRSFDWKADGSHQKYGVIAQELEAIAPEAVSKGETEDDMWGVDYSKLVPMLIKEVQSLRARVAQLEGE